MYLFVYMFILASQVANRSVGVALFMSAGLTAGDGMGQTFDETKLKKMINLHNCTSIALHSWCFVIY